MNENTKSEIFKKYNSMKKLKCKRYYSIGIYLINLIPLFFLIAEIFAEKLADKILGQYQNEIKIDFILSMIGLFLTYISIIFAILKYGFDKHNKVINNKKITKIIFRKNAFYGGEILIVITVVLSLINIINGLINNNLNAVAFSILQISFYITIYSLSYLTISNISSETLYYISVLRPLINDIRMNMRINENKKVSRCIEELDEILINICYNKDKSTYIEIFDMAINDFSKIRDWTIYELICKRIKKINEILDKDSLEIFRINEILIDYFKELIAFEKENICRANAVFLKKLKKQTDQITYSKIKEVFEKYGKEYESSFNEYKPEFAEEIVKQFKFT